MKSRAAIIRQSALTIALLSTVAACKDFLTVSNPNVVNAAGVNLTQVADGLALTAEQNLAYAYGRYIMWGGQFTGEVESSDINYPGNVFPLRRVDPSAVYYDYPNGTNQAGNSTYYEQPVRARAAAAQVLNALKATTGADTSTTVARAAMVAGYAFLMIAEHMCIGTVDGGPALSTTALLDSSRAYLTQAITVARAGSSSLANTLLNVALVGRARAHLQAGNGPGALADAQAVAPGFTFSIQYVAALATVPRLGNFLWHHTQLGTLSVPPAFRGLNDPRVVVIPPGQHSVNPNDGVTVLWIQGKYTNYASSIRLASRLEADYIAAEVMGTQAMLVLINQRRLAYSAPSYSGATDDASVLQEFMNQRGRDFWVEGRRMGDFRRHPGAVLNVPQPGTLYRKPSFGTIGTQTCWPLPDQEVYNNPYLRP